VVNESQTSGEAQRHTDGPVRRHALHEVAGILAPAFEAFGFAGLNSTDCVFANPSFVDV
jgi:hypothetical protein